MVPVIRVTKKELGGGVMSIWLSDLIIYIIQKGVISHNTSDIIHSEIENSGSIGVVETLASSVVLDNHFQT